jgi:hypothetical protein
MTPQELITELRSAAKGREEWQIIDTRAKICRKVYTGINGEKFAKNYLERMKKRYPWTFEKAVVRKEIILSPQEHLLQRAADCIEELIGG